VDAASQRLKKVNAELAKAQKELELLRGYLEASGKGSASAAPSPFAQRILATEDRLERLRKASETRPRCSRRRGSKSRARSKR
jgi:molecular chaperone GrpE (heat shock protein)